MNRAKRRERERMQRMASAMWQMTAEEPPMTAAEVIERRLAQQDMEDKLRDQIMNGGDC